MRDVLPGHTYPRYQEDLETISQYHNRYGTPGVGLFEQVRRLVEW